MLRTIKVLQIIGILSFKGFFRFIQSAFSSGINLMTLLQFSAKMFPDKLALADDLGRHSYKELFDRAMQLACVMESEHGIRKGSKVGLMCRNHVEMALYILAFSKPS
jgi:fatty-acyl-CoA synthase